MLIAPTLENEAERLRILEEMNILDSPPDANLDDITELAAHICSTPIALISLIDRDRQWFKSRVGLDVEQTPRDLAFCVHAIASIEDVFIVPDAREDLRFRDNLLVTAAPYIRFYAGLPLVTKEGVALGTLCVIDRVPRVLDSDKVSALQALRRQVVFALEQRRALHALGATHGELDPTRQGLLHNGDELERRMRNSDLSLAEANRLLLHLRAERARRDAELRRSEERFRATFEHAAVGIAHVSPDGRWLAVNEGLCQVVGYTREELLERTFQSMTHPADLAKDAGLTERLLHNEIESYSLEKRFRHKLGHDVWAHVTASLVRHSGGAPDYIITVVKDITERVHALQRLRHAEARLRSAVQVAALGYWEWDPVTGTAVFSPEYHHLMGFDDEPLPNRFEEWESRLHPEDRQRVGHALSRFLASDAAELHVGFRLLHRDGNYRWIAARAVPLKDDNGDATRIIVTHLDVTDAKVAQQRIRDAALHDPLTGLPNRALIFEHATQVLAASRRSGDPGALMFVDLDRFKTINDVHGHKTGDAVLQEVARRLGGATRAQDIVGRIGGDEFLVVLPTVSLPDGAEHVARHLLAAVNGPIRIDGLELHVSPSIGICAVPHGDAAVDDLIRYADVAMYRAKKAGQNRYEFFSEALEQAYFESRSIEKQMKLALIRRAFALHYQPIIDIRTERLVSVEALLRWPENYGRRVGPGEFIPIAEATGIIGPLSEWAMGEACRQHRQWLAQGLPAIPIALNVSPVQFQAREFNDQFRALIADSGIDAGCLQIEVTESMLMQDIAQASCALLQIKELGCKIALDDFGTGYSSLAYLSQLPIDKLKIDQSFVRRLDSDPACAAIIAAVVALGRSLGLQVVAEGIETDAVLERVRELGCEQAQGYFYSRPVSGDAFVEWYAAHVAERGT